MREMWSDDEAELDSIVGEWHWRKDEDLITPSARRKFNGRLAALPKRHPDEIVGRYLELLREAYFTTTLQYDTLADLRGFVPGRRPIGGGFGEWKVRAGCGDEISVTTRSKAQKPPLLCSICKENASSQLRLLPSPIRPRADEIEAYYRSDRWRQLSYERFRQQPWCSLCHGHRGGLVLHHNTYDRIGHEDETDLLVLCWDCHDHHHYDPREKLDATDSNNTLWERFSDDHSS